MCKKCDHYFMTRDSYFMKILDGEEPSNMFHCDCGALIERYRGEGDVACRRCHASYNPSGQRLRDDYRGNPSLYSDEVSDLEGYELQHHND